MTFEQYVAYAEEYYRENVRHQRKGQAYMNCLFAANERLYRDLTGTSLDPFYNDDILYEFADYALENWDAK